MASITLTPTESQIQDFLKHFHQQIRPNKNPYMRAFVKVSNASISIYTSGKVLLQGEGAADYTRFFGVDTPQVSSNQNLPLIGTDEVGNGSYFGGLAVVASFVKPEQHDFLRSLGVGDSKTLTDRKIQQLAPLLKKEILHQALLLSPKKYNEVIGERYNAVSVKVALHNQAIFLLLQKGAQAEKIVIDAFTSVKNYEKYLKNESNHFPNPITLEEKAENKYLAVAVSSIIARDLFLENLTQLGEELGFELPSGAGAASDKVASKILQAYGKNGLAYSAKLHFKNTEKAQKLLER